MNYAIIKGELVEIRIMYGVKRAALPSIVEIQMKKILKNDLVVFVNAHGGIIKVSGWVHSIYEVPEGYLVKHIQDQFSFLSNLAIRFIWIPKDKFREAGILW